MIGSTFVAGACMPYASLKKETRLENPGAPPFGQLEGSIRLNWLIWIHERRRSLVPRFSSLVPPTPGDAEDPNEWSAPALHQRNSSSVTRSLQNKLDVW